jgi:hypothetical protein
MSHFLFTFRNSKGKNNLSSAIFVILSGNHHKCPLENVLDEMSPNFGPAENVLDEMSPNFGPAENVLQ